MKRPRISVLIHTLDEAGQIEECLRSVEWADEIFLLDSFSTDGTAEIVRTKFPQVRLELRESRGSAAQKNHGIDRLRNDWVLVVDADERVTPELRDEILSTLADGPRFWAYSIARRNVVFDREVRFGLLGIDRVIRLFHRNHARYPNRRVHADLVVDGPVGRLRAPFIHNYVQSFDHLAEKMDRYAYWAAAQLYMEGKRRTWFHIGFHPFWRLIREFIGLAGFMDGTRGLVIAGMHAYYTFVKYARLWEFQRLAREGRPVPLPHFDDDPKLWECPWEKGRPEPAAVSSRASASDSPPANTDAQFDVGSPVPPSRSL